MVGFPRATASLAVLSAQEDSLSGQTAVQAGIMSSCNSTARSPCLLAMFKICPQLSTRAATELVGQLSHTEEIKGAIRDNGGILALMRCVDQCAIRPRRVAVRHC